MRAKCWLIAEPELRLSSKILAAARLRELPVQSCALNSLPDVPGCPGNLIALDFKSLRRLSASDRTKLTRQVAAGATCYLGGDLAEGEHYSLSPLASVVFQIGRLDECSGYQFTCHRLLPSALRGEDVRARGALPVARGLPQAAQPLLVARGPDGSQYAPAFVIELGAGLLICDVTDAAALSGTETAKPDPARLVRLLENPATRATVVASLVAVDRAAGRDSSRPVGCDIVIDDRPVNLDYFNVGALRNFLEYLERRCPGVHVDFGWTPDQSRPSHRYVNTLKHFNTGFLWHGLLHHIDHRTIANPEVDFAEGHRLVEDISRRYQVKFQRVMVFPYEKDTESCVALLKREGFIAKAETPDDTKRAMTADTAEFELSRGATSSRFATLTRDSFEKLTRDRMLARAAIGLPIIAALHPRDVALRRLAKLRPDRGSAAALGDLLDFISTKGLRPEPLEQIAEDVLASGANYG
jgi:hypothetical protein